MRRWLFLFAALAASDGAFADDASKQAKLLQLTRALGLQEGFESAANARKQQEAAMSKEIVDDLLTSADVKNDALRARLNAAMKAFDSKLAATAGPEKLASEFAQAFGAKFTEEEIDRLLQYYNSDLGKKEVAASRQAIAEVTERNQKEQEATLTKAIAEFKAELDKIMAEDTPPVKRKTRK